MVRPLGMVPLPGPDVTRYALEGIASTIVPGFSPRLPCCWLAASQSGQRSGGIAHERKWRALMGRIDHHRPQYPDLFGQFKKSYHLEMVMDRVRTEAVFEALLRSLSPQAIFCELGCGTALFSTYAAAR